MSDFWQGFIAALVGALAFALLFRSRDPYQPGGYQPIKSLDPNNPPQGGSGVPLRPPSLPVACANLVIGGDDLVDWCRKAGIREATIGELLFMELREKGPSGYNFERSPVEPDPSVQPPPFVEINRSFES